MTFQSLFKGVYGNSIPANIIIIRSSSSISSSSSWWWSITDEGPLQLLRNLLYRIIRIPSTTAKQFQQNSLGGLCSPSVKNSPPHMGWVILSDLNFGGSKSNGVSSLAVNAGYE